MCARTPATGDAEISIEDIFQTYPWTETLAGLALLLLAAFIANFIAKQIVVRLIERVIRASPLRGESQHIGAAVAHLSNVVPAIVIERGIELVPDMPERLVLLTQGAAAAFIIFTIARTLSDVLDIVNDTYEHRSDAASKPIKGYLQVGKIVIYAAATILIVAVLIGESPFLLLSGLGAMAAVLMLIFRDTILSLVASVQLRSNDMLRMGDWIEMPDLNANGDVIDIALHTVKVENFDKTVTTIPTHRLISDTYRNWRFMSEYGGRRIMRSLFVDTATIRFMSDEQWRAMRRFKLLRAYIEAKDAELAEWNAKHAGAQDESGEEPVNRRRPTNIGTFRAYALAYVRAHPRISQHATLLVRQLAPTDRGVPLEIYCFTNTVNWAEYEGIQSDIFDHMLSILPEFGLRAFQHPTGNDVRDLMALTAGTRVEEQPAA